MLHWNIVHSDVQRPRNGLQLAGLLSPAHRKIRIKYCRKCHYFAMENLLYRSSWRCALPPVLRYQLDQVICWYLVAFLFEERRETRLSVQCSMTVLKHGPTTDRRRLDPVKRTWQMHLKASLPPGPLTLWTRQTAYGTFPVYYRTACWLSKSSERSVKHKSRRKRGRVSKTAQLIFFKYDGTRSAQKLSLTEAEQQTKSEVGYKQ